MSRRQLVLGGIAITALVTGALALTSTRELEPRVQFVGLETWTPEMVEDSLAHYAPGVPLTSAACAIVLRDSLGFPQAAVSRHTSRSLLGQETQVTITVVEPSDSARVRFAAPYADTLRDRPRWNDGVELLRAEYGLFHFFQDHDFARGRSDRFQGGSAPARAVALRDAVLGHDSDQDFEAAIRTLATDANLYNRTFAALVLGNFAERPGSWHALMKALQRPPGHATPAAMLMLGTLAQNVPIRVPWKPLRNTLDALVDGTNLFAYPVVLETLVATRVDPALGRDLIREGGDLLIGILSTDDHPDARLAREFLTHVAGEDLGSEPRAWGDWIRAL